MPLLLRSLCDTERSAVAYAGAGHARTQDIRVRWPACSACRDGANLPRTCCPGFRSSRSRPITCITSDAEMPRSGGRRWRAWPCPKRPQIWTTAPSCPASSAGAHGRHRRPCLPLLRAQTTQMLGSPHGRYGPCAPLFCLLACLPMQHPEAGLYFCASCLPVPSGAHLLANVLLAFLPVCSEDAKNTVYLAFLCCLHVEAASGTYSSSVPLA